MVTYVLVPKRPIEQAVAQDAVKPGEARAQLLSRAADFGVQDAKILESYGLTEQRLESAELPAQRYFRLPHVGVLVASFENKLNKEEAAGSLDDYYFVPDIEMALPEAQTTKDNLKYVEVNWPQESGIAEAHKQKHRGQGVLIGVLDTGCDSDHEAHSAHTQVFRFVPLNTQGVRDVRGFDPGGHGTHVCGIIAGEKVGIAPEARIWVASVIESETVRTSLRRILVGLDWLVRVFSEPENIQLPALVNMSLGFPDSWLSPGDLNMVRIALRRIFQTLVNNLQVLPVVAIGNDYAGNMRAPGYFPEALAVGAVDFINKVPAAFSGGGISPINSLTKPDIAGYGVDVLSSYERDCQDKSFYRRLSGTSMATAYVTAIAALYASRDPSLVGTTLRAKLLQESLSLPHPKDRVGAGLACFV